MTDIDAAHKHSIRHRAEVDASTMAGCFYCLAIYPPGEITEWLDEVTGETALCPRCGIDSVIGDASGYPVTKAFLTSMRKRCFGR